MARLGVASARAKVVEPVEEEESGLFRESMQAMKPGARCLVAEPKFHVSVQDFNLTIAAAEQHGLKLDGRPDIWGSRTAVFIAGD